MSRQHLAILPWLTLPGRGRRPMPSHRGRKHKLFRIL